MITYLDTSSLVKLYVEETGTDDVRMLVSEAAAVATSGIAYPEMRAALARRYRERSLGRGQYVAVKRALEADWQRLVTVAPTSALCFAAGQLAERHRLRGFDSVHLASFVDLLQSAGAADVEFSSFDTALNRAAAFELRAWRRGRARRS